jgi:hypothetical protein
MLPRGGGRVATLERDSLGRDSASGEGDGKVGRHCRHGGSMPWYGFTARRSKCLPEESLQGIRCRTRPLRHRRHPFVFNVASFAARMASDISSSRLPRVFPDRAPILVEPPDDRVSVVCVQRPASSLTGWTTFLGGSDRTRLAPRG